MAGTILENLSTRKMLLISLFFVILEIVCIIIGACIAPQPAMVIPQTSIPCINRSFSPNHWYLPKKCEILKTFEAGKTNDVSADNVVFALIVPQSSLELSRWFQFMLTLISLRTSYNPSTEIKKGSVLTMKIRVGYSNDLNSHKSEEAWQELFHATEERELDCVFNHPKTDQFIGYEYDCEPLHLFLLGSQPHKRYLINLHLPTTIGGSTNTNLGRMENIDFVSIMQTGGFTKVWISLKTVMCVLLLFPIIWYWKRVQELGRKSTLIEKIIFFFALSMEFLNIPFELFTIFFDVYWMLVFTDLRQGLVYVILFCFWIIFIGEHLMDQPHRNQIAAYKYQLLCISIATLSMLSFELAERGVQILLPSATIWSNHSAAYTLLIIGGIFAALYLIMLLYLIYKAIRSIHYKRRFTLPTERRKKFEKIVKRFYILLFFTFFTALITIIFFFIQQSVGRMVEEWFSTEIQSSSGFFTGTYGLWNIYTMVVLWLYSPSHKLYEEDLG